MVCVILEKYEKIGINFFLQGIIQKINVLFKLFFLLFTSVILSTDVKTFNVCFLHRAQCNNRCKNLIYYIGHDFHLCDMLRQFSKKKYCIYFSHQVYIITDVKGVLFTSDPEPM